MGEVFDVAWLVLVVDWRRVIIVWVVVLWEGRWMFL